ncbi:MAG: DUF2723 domain-containing protein, partial [Elusimicrobiota bacterium]|nr:DUF2723 domain-containing protein [Elusimicrobiota bacterium]
MKTKELSPKSVWPPVTSFFVFLVYLFTTGTTVSFYRDSGELITAASTLSIAHSPGYPLYMIMGKFFTEVLALLGAGPAYAMNIFSALCGALAVYFIILAVSELTDNIYAAEFAGLLAAFTYINWMLAVVAEMYSLSLMLGALLLYLMIQKRYILFSFIFGLSLGNHLSILFAVLPMAAALYLFPSRRKKIPFISAVLYFTLGLSVY